MAKINNLFSDNVTIKTKLDSNIIKGQTYEGLPVATDINSGTVMIDNITIKNNNKGQLYCTITGESTDYDDSIIISHIQDKSVHITETQSSSIITSENHIEDTDKHLTVNERSTINKINTHILDTNIHINQEEIANIELSVNHANNSTIHMSIDDKDNLNNLSSHLSNSNIHITEVDKDKISNIDMHISNNNLHLSEVDRENINSTLSVANAFPDHLSDNNIHFNTYEKETLLKNISDNTSMLNDLDANIIYTNKNVNDLALSKLDNKNHEANKILVTDDIGNIVYSNIPLNSNGEADITGVINELASSLEQIATTGTTIEAVQSKVENMAKQGLIQAYTLGNNTVEPKKTTFFDKIVGENLLDPSLLIGSGYWVNPIDGTISEPNTYTNGTSANKNKTNVFAFIPVIPNEKYSFARFISANGSKWGGSIKAYNIVGYNIDKTYVSTIASQNSVDEFTIPSNVRYISVTIYESDLNYTYNNILIKGLQSELVSFAPYEEEYFIKDIYLKEKNNVVKEQNVKLNLPSTIYSVVGDTLEIFYKGIIQAINPSNYNLKVVSSKGNAYSKKYVYTPIATDSNFNISFYLYNNDNVLLDSKVVTVKVSSVKPNPSTEKYILDIGDSLTVNGERVTELKRRLTSTSGNPVGNGLTNLKFIGKCTRNGTNYEGFGGWSYNNYLTNSNPPNYWIKVSSGMKTNTASEQSIWKDSNEKMWQLETIDSENNMLKFKQYPYSANNVMPTSGSLIFVAGGGDTSNIVYTNANAEAGNPFWYDTKVDFKAYCSQLKIPQIDYCNILLGWNGIANIENLKSKAIEFIDKLHADYPNCKISLMGLQLPSIDGLGTNYGANDSWNYYEVVQNVFKLNNAYEEIANSSTYSSFVTFVNVASQFDTDNNMQQSTRVVNTRSSKTETYGTNGVHPALEGYLQIADIEYRYLMNNI